MKYNDFQYNLGLTTLEDFEYKPGSDKDADFAIKYIDKVNMFLKQKVDEKCSFQDSLAQLKKLFK